MSNQLLALLILLFPVAGAILLAGRGWRFPRIFTVVVGPGVVWASLLATLALFGAAYWKLYRAPEACEPDGACADPRVRTRQRVIFWAMLVVVVPLLAFPWYAPLFY